MKKDFNELALLDDGDLDFFGPYFNDFFRVPSFKPSREFNKLMKTDIKENENNYELEVEMPGVDKKDVNLELKDGYLTISSKVEKNSDEKDKKGNYIRRERFYGSSSRSFYVGNDIKEHDINASMQNGVLNIVIPKKQPEIEQTKKIEIK